MNDGTDEDFGSDDHGHHEENESCRAVYGQCNSQEKPDGQVMSKNELRSRSPDMATRENCVSEVGSDVQDAIRAASQYGAENRHSCKERTDDNIGSRILLRHCRDLGICGGRHEKKSQVTHLIRSVYVSCFLESKR